MKVFKLVSLMIPLLTAQALQAQGILFVQQETRDGQSSTNQVQLDKTHMRVETHVSGDDVAVVFDAASQTVRMINFGKKTYIEFNKAQMDQMKQQMAGAAAQMSAAQKQIEEQMKNMPPAQRAIVEQAMRGRGGVPGAGPPAAAAQARPQYRAAGSDKVAQWSCTKYEGLRGQEKVADLCTVDPRDFGLTAADFDIAKQLAEFLKTLAPQSADQLFMAATPEEQGFSGFPVRQILYANGKVTATIELREFRRETFPASNFEVPAGFTKQNMGARQ